MTKHVQDRNISSSFAKGLSVLAVFDAATPCMTLAEIARRTNQDRATARRGALTLVQAGYLRQQGRMLSLTPRVLALAGGFLQGNQFGRRVQPVLNQHARKLGAELSLATLDRGRVLLLAQSTTEGGPVTYGFTPGAHIPLLHTSLGRMLMSCLPQADAEALVQGAEIPQHTEQSLLDPEAILAQVEQARSQGYCLTDSEFEPGIVGYAVPLSRPGKTPVVLGSSAPGGLATGPKAEELLQGLQLCAAELRQTHAVDDL
ncbi:MAG: IclR family transcriptional regulator [Roseobacter sp. MedPE-SWchi]|nr:MAG: IclR family transcriptional regulator [Roseobacter sp. MedPE-SWchi]